MESSPNATIMLHQAPQFRCRFDLVRVRARTLTSLFQLNMCVQITERSRRKSEYLNHNIYLYVPTYYCAFHWTKVKMCSILCRFICTFSRESGIDMFILVLRVINLFIQNNQWPLIKNFFASCHSEFNSRWMAFFFILTLQFCSDLIITQSFFSLTLWICCCCLFNKMVILKE